MTGRRPGPIPFAAAAATDDQLDSLSVHAGEHTKAVLFLAGECSSWICPEQQARHEAVFANATLVAIPDAGHDVFWGNAEATLETVRAFFAK